MSRSGYNENIDNWDLIRWRGQVASAIRGKRGQKLLQDLVTALETLPEKKLIPNSLEAFGGVCALGAVGKMRGVNLEKLDPECPESVAEAFGIAHQMAKEIVYENDEGGPWKETDERRYTRMLVWAKSHLKKIEATTGATPKKEGE